MRILVIEDERQIAESLKSSLKAECFAVDIAEDGERGLYLASTSDYDAIILDNLLPKKEGVDVCRKLREMGKQVPILILSVKSGSDTKVELLNAGADDYLSKPFSFEELLARIRALLRRPQQLDDDIISIEDIRLDTIRHTVRRGDTDIYLTRKEFMLLEYLMRNQGIVLSRGMIMEHVWDMNADPFSNTIESHILSLRKKIADQKTPKRLIHTIPGRGYKFEYIQQD